MVIKLKKIILLLCVCLFIITGCELNNNPTSKTEELLGNYQGLDKNITYNEQDLINEEVDNNEIKEQYIKIIKKQYRNLEYEIKEETIDGDRATITTEIEVVDYKKVLNQYINNTVKTDTIHKEIIKKLNNAKEKVTYTIDFTVTKDKKGNWEMDNLTKEQKEKLLGIY